MSDSEKLKEILNHMKMTASSFSRYIGLSTPQILYDITKGRNGISKDLADSITAKCLNIDRVWLLTGEGEMLKKDIPEENTRINDVNPDFSNKTALIPLLPISAQGGSLNQFFVSVKDSDCEHIISPIKGADFAITVSGDSMAPGYPSGSQILIKKINEKAFIEWGRVYVLDTCNGTVVKTIVPGKEGCLRCESINLDPKFAPFEICLADIFGMYRVMMCMAVK